MRPLLFACVASMSLCGCEIFGGSDLTYAEDSGSDATLDSQDSQSGDAADSSVADASDTSSEAPEASGDGSADSPTDASEAGGTTDCTAKPGTTPMVRVTTDWGSFCIDVTEVTNAQYNEFYDAKVPFTSSLHACTAISAWTAKVTKSAYADDARDHVTWCDANAYCQWAGKRLCGHLGDGKALPWDDRVDMSRSEWTFACRSGDDAKNDWPYGGHDQIKGRCNDQDAMRGGVVKPKSFADCHGVGAPFAEIYDLAGNTAEWINSCHDTGSGVSCGMFGGNWELPGFGNGRCDAGSDWESTWPNGGIRCCK